MPLLLYCIARSSGRLDDSQCGLAGSPVSRVEMGSIAAFVSVAPDSSIWLRAPLKTAAMEFHRVLMNLFHRGPVIPFRFPTIFPDDSALAEHLRKAGREYSAQLDQFERFAQMEARIASPSDQPATATSGTEYLRQRQKREHALAEVASRIREAAAAADWRQRPTRGGLRCFALIDRGGIADFRERMAKLNVPAEFSVRITGPWPVAEFLSAETNQPKTNQPKED